MGKNFNPHTAARALARRLALQALYRWQINPGPWQDLVSEFATDTDMARADGEYFRELLERICASQTEFDAELAAFLDRPPAQLDPIEHAVLLIGTYELRTRPDIPFRVIINEAVGLTRRYGATDGHKYINGVLDRAARAWRPDEH
jgi:N utilization substance protein B